MSFVVYGLMLLLASFVMWALTREEKKVNGEKMQSGELIVTGQDSIEVTLKSMPSRTHVHFKDHDPEIPPCNPHHYDELDWEVHYSNKVASNYVLRISWNVSSTREIKWVAYY